MRLNQNWKPIPLSQVQVTDPFWKHWQEIIRANTLEIQYQQLATTGRLENFRRAARGESGTFEGFRYNDSDVYKWLEAACYLISALGPNPALQKRVDEVVEVIEKAQTEDGYLQTYYQLQCPHLRWRNLNWGHELYCGGHMLESAVAHFDATGSDRMVNVARKYMDHVMSVFGPDKKKGFDGHEEIELALFKLASVCPDKKTEYEDWARWQVEIRGTRPTHMEAEKHDEEAAALGTIQFWNLVFPDGKNYVGDYAQDHLPIRQHDKVVGHAVRAMYLYTGATLAFAGRNDTAVEDALERVWTNLTEKQMYVTGGIGQSDTNEGFTGDYDLPNRTAYAETCASCGLVFWARALANSTADPRFAQIMERALYNGAMAGIGQNGDRFFYDNPLESHGGVQREGWFSCACCPPNIARLIASVGSYAVAETGDGYALHLPVSCELNGAHGKARVEVTASKIVLHNDSDEHIVFWVREEEHYHSIGVAAGGSHTVSRHLEPKWVRSHPSVLENAGRVAMVYGEFVYCLEEADLGAKPQHFAADTMAPITGEGKDLWVGGKLFTPKGDSLYSSTPLKEEYRESRLIPYYQWANRGAGAMQVWIRELPVS